MSQSIQRIEFAEPVKRRLVERVRESVERIREAERHDRQARAEAQGLEVSDEYRKQVLRKSIRDQTRGPARDRRRSSTRRTDELKRDAAHA